MAEFLSLVYMGVSSFTLLMLVSLVIILSVNFARKKTTGTALLLAAYITFLVQTVVSFVHRLVQLIGVDPNSLYITRATAGLLTTIGLTFLYLFATRHILRDSELIRIFASSVFFIFFGIATGMVILEANLIAPEFRVISKLEVVTADLVTVGYNSIITVFQIILSLIITIRIGIRALILARKSDQLVRKRGLQAIGIGILLYLVAGMLSAAISSLASVGPAFAAAGILVRAIFFIFAYIYMYLGWIMPSWFRKMIRKRSWFETQYIKTSKSP